MHGLCQAQHWLKVLCCSDVTPSKWQRMALEYFVYHERAILILGNFASSSSLQVDVASSCQPSIHSVTQSNIIINSSTVFPLLGGCKGSFDGDLVCAYFLPCVSLHSNVNKFNRSAPAPSHPQLSVNCWIVAVSWTPSQDTFTTSTVASPWMWLKVGKL